MTTSWTDVTPSTTSWNDVSTDTVHYKKARRGQLYAGYKGGLVAGALTIPVLVDGTPTSVAFYSGYIGAAHGPTSWDGVSPSTTSWNDVSPTPTSWNDVTV